MSDYHFTLTIYPWRWMRRAVVLGVLAAAFVVPKQWFAAAAVAAHVRPSPTQEELTARAEFESQVETIEAELVPVVRGATTKEVHEVSRTIVEESAKYGFDPLWVLALIEVESHFDVEACSPTGARGLMQILRSTFRTVSSAVRVTDPVENVRAGITYLGQLSGQFKSPESILRAYNAGPKNTLAYIKAQRNKEDLSHFSQEMREYPDRVMSKYQKLLKKNGKDPRHAKKLWRVT